MEKSKKLPQVTGSLLVKAFDEIVGEFVNEEGILPETIYLVAEGDSQLSIGRLIVSQCVFQIPSYYGK